MGSKNYRTYIIGTLDENGLKLEPISVKIDLIDVVSKTNYGLNEVSKDSNIIRKIFSYIFLTAARKTFVLSTLLFSFVSYFIFRVKI